MEIAKASLDPQKIAKRALNLACLPACLGFLRSFWDFIVRAPMRLIRNTCVLKELRSDSA